MTDIVLSYCLSYTFRLNLVFKSNNKTYSLNLNFDTIDYR